MNISFMKINILLILIPYWSYLFFIYYSDFSFLKKFSFLFLISRSVFYIFAYKSHFSTCIDIRIFTFIVYVTLFLFFICWDFIIFNAICYHL